MLEVLPPVLPIRLALRLTAQVIPAIPKPVSSTRSPRLARPARPGGDERDRTDDPLLAKQVLSQLSYTPIFTSEGVPFFS